MQPWILPGNLMEKTEPCKKKKKNRERGKDTEKESQGLEKVENQTPNPHGKANKTCTGREWSKREWGRGSRTLQEVREGHQSGAALGTKASSL